MASYDEASRCPKCQNPGEVRSEQKLNDGSKLLTFYCKNEACKWFDTPWNVSVRPDGTIPDANTNKREKTYIGFEHDAVTAQRIMNQLTMEYENSLHKDGPNGRK